MGGVKTTDLWYRGSHRTHLMALDGGRWRERKRVAYAVRALLTGAEIGDTHGFRLPTFC